MHLGTNRDSFPNTVFITEKESLYYAVQAECLNVDEVILNIYRAEFVWIVYR